MTGHTPTMLLRTSRSDGIDSSPVMMARRRPERDINQSRCSASFKRVIINSVIKKGSKDPRTEVNTFCRHRFRRRRSNIGYSNSLLTHFTNTRRKCRPTHVTHQKQQQGSPNNPQQPQLTRALTNRVWHHWRSGMQRPRQPDGKCHSPTFA